MNAKNFGVVYDGKTINTEALQNAIDATRGKEILEIGPGTCLTGPLSVSSNTHIKFLEGTTLKFIDDFDQYPPVFSHWEGVDCYCLHPLLWVHEAENVIIEGNGTIDGSGQKWWDYIRDRRFHQPEPETPLEKQLAALNPDYKNQPGGGGGRQCQFLRPALLQVFKSKNVTLKDFFLTQSPFWTLHPIYTDHLVIDGVRVVNPYETPNTDGIDVECCTNVELRNCFVDVGDDGIALKSGSGMDGIKAARPTTDVKMSGCTVKQAHGGFVIGSETAAGVRNVIVEDCKFLSTDRGIRIKTRRGRGGHIDNITIRNTVMDDVICPIAFNMYYKWGSDDPALFSLDKQPIDIATPQISNVTIENVEATNCKGSTGFLVGLPEMPITNVKIRNAKLYTVENPDPSLEIEMTRGLPETTYTGIRVRNAEVELENVITNVNPVMIDETK